LEDYEDFLRQRKLRQWSQHDAEAQQVSAWAYKSNRTYETYRTYLASPEMAANAAICLINQANFLLDRQIKSLEKKFVKNGGWTEKIRKEREQYKKKTMRTPLQKRWA